MLPRLMRVDMGVALLPRAIRPVQLSPARRRRPEPLWIDGLRAYPEAPPRGYRLFAMPVRTASIATEASRMSAGSTPRIVLVPPSADVAEIAREMAPAGFELVMPQAAGAELEAALPEAAVHGVLSQRAHGGCVLSRRPEAEARAAAERRLRRRRHRGGAPRQGAGRQQRRRQRHLGRRARADADAHGVAQGRLAARQRGGRALARQRPGAAHVRALRQDARHRRPRHHRQEGGPPGARPSACACSTTTSRG